MPQSSVTQTPCKTQPFKKVAEIYSLNDVSIILFIDENVFTVTIPKDQQSDQLYAYTSTKKKNIMTKCQHKAFSH